MTFAAVQNMKYLPNKLFAQWYDETWFDLDLSLTGLFFRGFFTLEKFELETFDLEKFIRVTFDLEKFEREFFHLGFFQREFFHLGFFHQEFLGSGKLWKTMENLDFWDLENYGFFHLGKIWTI